MKATLYIRVRTADAKYVTTKPAFTATGRIRPGYAMIDGTAEQFDSVTYVLRYTRDGKPAWESIDDDANKALEVVDRKNHELQGKRFVNTAETGEPVPAPVPKPVVATPSETRRAIADAVKDYVDEIRLTKKQKTHSAYKSSLIYFEQSCKKTHLEDIDRNHM